MTYHSRHHHLHSTLSHRIETEYPFCSVERSCSIHLQDPCFDLLLSMTVLQQQESKRIVQALLHRAVLGVPMSTLKYAMTLDGKIATPTGHAAWVSNSASRQRVFAQRAVADAVIVGGNTVRRDNPRLTTRREGGHRPIRVVMSRTLDLPEVCTLSHFSPRCFATLYRMSRKGSASKVGVTRRNLFLSTALRSLCVSREDVFCPSTEFAECGATTRCIPTFRQIPITKAFLCGFQCISALKISGSLRR